MSEWKEIELGNNADILSSKRIFAADYVSEGIPFYRSKEAIERALGQPISNPLFISKDKYDSIKDKYGAPIDGDILIAAVGERAGIPYLVSGDGDFYFKDGNLIWIRNFTKDLDSTFLLYFLNSRIGQFQLNNMMIGSAQKALTIVGLKGMRIEIPEIEEQKQIAKTLSNLDQKVNLLRQQNQTLEELAQTLFKRWFVEFEFPNENGQPYKSSGGKMIDSVPTSIGMGEIPEGWQLSTIGENIETIGGGTPSTTEPTFWEDGEVLWYSPTDLTKEKSMYSNGSAKKITKLGLQKSSAKLFPAYSLLMTSRATVGELTINTHTACTNQGFITLIPNDSLSIYYLYNWLKSKLKTVHNLASGSTFPEISKTDFRNIEVLLASKCVHSEFDDIIKPIFKSIENNTKEIQSLTQLRDTLLPKLMSGELTINQEALKNV
ncbi:hypothetical protein GCM10009118_12940 [Wandonia haliotis]|uniref:Type I restriction modification DNA specificity domain-containing protein n=1 Tax=Wandonia haliotis TaxID=574963 RepID=A0ABN1MPP2_9FLAO